jgi:hypothetical protein
MQVTTVGLDLAKNIFQVHGITADGTVAFNKSLRRAQLLQFSRPLSHVSSAWRPADPATTGRGNSGSWAMKSD